MTKINDGGPAFPVQTAYIAFGMSLRDYFATHTDVSDVKFPTVKAVADFLGVTEPDENDNAAIFEMLAHLQARLKYMAADAMLKAREVSP